MHTAVSLTLTLAVLPVGFIVMSDVKKMRSLALKCTVPSLAMETPSKAINTSPFCNTYMYASQATRLVSVAAAAMLVAGLLVGQLGSMPCRRPTLQPGL